MMAIKNAVTFQASLGDVIFLSSPSCYQVINNRKDHLSHDYTGRQNCIHLALICIGTVLSQVRNMEIVLVAV